MMQIYFFFGYYIRKRGGKVFLPHLFYIYLLTKLYEHLKICPGRKIVVLVIRFNLQSLSIETCVKREILPSVSPLRTL